MDIKLLKYQMEFLKRDSEKRVALVTGVGCGKTTIAAIWLIMQACKGQNSIVSSQSFPALHKVMFKELLRQCRRIGIAVDYNKNDKTLTFPNGAIIYGASSEAPDAVLGLTDISNYLGDEASYTDAELRNNCEERCRGTWNGKPIVARYRYTTTPSNTPTSEWFVDMITAMPEIVIHATTYENIFLDPSFVEDQKQKYGGEKSPLFRQQIMGELLSGDVSNVIVRLDEFAKVPVIDGSDECFMGCDLAGNGDDASVFVIANRHRILEVVENHDGKAETDNEIFLNLYRKWKPRAYAWDNTGGFGRNIEVLASTHQGGIPVNFGSSDDDETVANKRAGMYMRYRKAMLEGFYVDQAMYPKIVKETRQTTFHINSSGKVAILPKEKIREKMGGRSPDTLDALVLCMEAMNSKDVVITNSEYGDMAARIASAIA